MITIKKLTINTLVIGVFLAFNACIPASHLQCDEVYINEYNCEIPREYTYGSYTPYTPYYPNTQKIWLVPVPVQPKSCDRDNQSPQRVIRGTQRTEILPKKNN